MHTLGKDDQKFGIYIWNTLDQGGLVTQREVTLKTKQKGKVKANLLSRLNLLHFEGWETVH